jgi:hypothetical protein
MYFAAAYQVVLVVISPDTVITCPVEGVTITAQDALIVVSDCDIAVIVAVPKETPVTTPSATVATEGLDDFHVTV